MVIRLFGQAQEDHSGCIRIAPSVDHHHWGGGGGGGVGLVSSRAPGRSWHAFPRGLLIVCWLDARRGGDCNIRPKTWHGCTNSLFTVCDSESVHDIVWVPAHSSGHDIGTKCLGNGDQRLTGPPTSILMCSPSSLPKIIECLYPCVRPLPISRLSKLELPCGLLKPRCWPTMQRNYICETQMHLDVSRLRSGGSARFEAASRPRARTNTKHIRPAVLGGHSLGREVSGSGSESACRCAGCRKWSRVWCCICKEVCKGSVAHMWACKVRQSINSGTSVGIGHRLLLSG